MGKRPQSPKSPSANSKKIRANAYSVADALDQADCWPASVGEGLGKMAMASLTTNKDDRHALQAGFVDMIGRALEQVRGGLQAKVDEHQKELDASSEERNSVQGALDAATAASNAAKEALAAASTKNHENKDNLQATKKALAEARDKAKRTEAVVASEQKEHTDMEQAFTDAVTASKEAAVAKGPVRHFMNLGKKHGIDEQLLEYWHDSAIQEPGARGGFDALVQTELDEAIAPVRARLSQTAGGGEAKNAACLAASADAETAFNMATTASESGKTALTEAEAHAKTTHATLVDAQKAHKKYEHSVAPQMRRLQAAQDDLANFVGGALEAFANSKDLSPPPAPAEEAPVAPVSPPAPAPVAAPVVQSPVKPAVTAPAQVERPAVPVMRAPAVPASPGRRGGRGSASPKAPSPSMSRNRSPPPPSPSPSVARR